MYKRKDRLARATERTMMKLAGEEVVLPSRYFRTFVEEDPGGDAREEEPVSREIDEGIEKIQALENRLFGRTDQELSTKIENIRREVETVQDDLYRDPFSGAFNHQWLFRYRLDRELRFLESGSLGLMEMPEYRELLREYGQAAALGVLRQVVEYINKYSLENALETDIVRFDESRFAFFLPRMPEQELSTLLASLQASLQDVGYRHRRRRFTLDFVIVGTGFVAGEPFTLVLDRVEDQLFDKRPS